MRDSSIRRWDYKTSELGIYRFNFSTAFLDFFAWLGWATELKTVSEELIRRRLLRTGDGSHKYSKMKSDEERLKAYINERTVDANGNHIHHEEDRIWGWDDQAMSPEDKKYVTVLRQNVAS
jgi:stearoyl-CoA desaturase (Delta-9 desaturase)